jgi:transcriptional regulator with PAS, ATPase and Fis domain
MSGEQATTMKREGASPAELPRPGTTTEVSEDGHEHALVRRFRLSVTQGPDSGLVRVSNGHRLVIGTHESCQLVLSDRTVSRFHCEIDASSGRPFLRDCESLNGTLVQGLSVKQAYLSGRTTLRLGHSEVLFELATEQAKVRLSDRNRFGRLIGCSPAMRTLFAVLEGAAATDSTVLIEGESGTGKEVAAEALHELSPRADKPFVVVDCGAIPKDLVESELFGHRAGAFTGALTDRKGAFQLASGGTLFLDEIGELHPAIQPKLLGALERREIKPVGASQSERVDVRVIAATNRNLRAAVNARTFRSDLYYRLAVLEVSMPPLRERLEDLPMLVERFLADHGAGHEEVAALQRPEFIAELAQHRWPGNVRELRNYLERCVAFSAPTPLPALLDGPDEPLEELARLPYKEARDAFQRQYVRALMRRSDNNITAAARTAGLERVYVYRLLRKHRLR